MEIIGLDKIKQRLSKIDLIPVIEQAFTDFSQGLAVVPPVGEMTFDDPPGDVHIKYGYTKNSDYYVIKIASGFYQNQILNLPTSNGLMLLFSKKSGELLSILLDEGYLTNVRTAIAGAIAAKYLAPKQYKAIGIVGTGTQAKMQLAYLKEVSTCRNVIVYGRQEHNLKAYVDEMSLLGFKIKATTEISTLTDHCQLIVTTTPSTTPILHVDQLLPGAHITAIGSDTPEKIELHPSIIKAADIVVTDSIEQAKTRGEIYHALKNQEINEDKKIIEIGQIINRLDFGRRHDAQLTVADFTGIATQDVKIAEAIYLDH